MPERYTCAHCEKTFDPEFVHYGTDGGTIIYFRVYCSARCLAQAEGDDDEDTDDD